MKIVGMMCARNEAWILPLSIRVALEWCDELALMLHVPDDATWDVLVGLPTNLKRRIVLSSQLNPDWDEMSHRNDTIRSARLMGATHLAICDADEVASRPLRGQIRDLASALHAGEILTVPMFNLRGSMTRRHVNGIWGSSRVISTVWADGPGIQYPLTKQFHHREPIGTHQFVSLGAPPMLHAWGASERRLVAKHALYKCIETLEWPMKSRSKIDATYSQAIYGPRHSQKESWNFDGVPPQWLSEEEVALVDLEAEPWQEGEVHRLIQEHGRERFSGLDLFGF